MPERPKFYMKLPHQLIRERRLLRLEPEERWCFLVLQVLANESPECGKLLVAPGVPLTIHEMTQACSLNPGQEKVLETMLGKAEQLGLMVTNAGCWVITGLAESQQRKPSDYPEATRERQAKARGRKGRDKGVTQQERERSKGKEHNKSKLNSKSYSKSYSNTRHAVTRSKRRDKGVTKADFELAVACYNVCIKFHTDNFGPPELSLQDDMWGYCKTHAPPLGEEDIHQAFKEACTHNVLNWGYVKAILDRLTADKRGGG